MEHPSLRRDQSVKIIQLFSKSNEELEFNGIVSLIDYLPYNCAIPKGLHVNHVYVKLSTENYKNILKRGWSIYCYLNNTHNLRKCVISSEIDKSSNSMEVYESSDKLGCRKITINYSDIDSILIWHEGYKIIPL
jgi:hypothetical protein